MAKYRVKPGRVFGAGGKFPAGTVVEIDPKDAEPFLDLLIPLSAGNKPVTPLRNELSVVLEGDLTQNFVEPEDIGEMELAEGEIDLVAAEAEKVEEKKADEIDLVADEAEKVEEKKPARRKSKAK